MSCDKPRRRLPLLGALLMVAVCTGCPPAEPDSRELRPGLHSGVTTSGSVVTSPGELAESLRGDIPDFAPLPSPEASGIGVEAAPAGEAAKPGSPSEPDMSAASAAAVRPTGEAATASLQLAPIPLQLPTPAFRGTPVPLDEPNMEKPSGKPRPAFLAPEGTANLALNMPVAASDPMPTAGELDMVTDGNKEASDFAYLELHPGSQWVQIDLGAPATIFAVVVWHNHAQARVYRDVVVQIGNDPDFLAAETVFNNDYDNSSGLGIGSDLGYVETSEGRLIDCRGLVGRYVRLYSRGNHMDPKNHYTEVEVYGIFAR